MGFKSNSKIKRFCCLYLHNLKLITQASFRAILRTVARQEPKANTFFTNKCVNGQITGVFNMVSTVEVSPSFKTMANLCISSRYIPVSVHF